MELRDLRQASVATGFTADQLRWYIRRGHLTAVQPSGRKGKWYVPADELARLMQPVQPPQEKK